MISRIQENFDKWNPPRFPKDNLTKSERTFMKEAIRNENIIYMWEDKGPSFVKMTKEQYIQAGENELKNENFYVEIMDDVSKEIKVKNDILVDAIAHKEEITEKVAEFLKAGDCKSTIIF